MPRVNLVSNIGESPEATHPHGKAKISNMAVEAIGFPLSHPPYLFRDNIADKNTEEIFFTPDSFMTKILKKINREVKR